jgi:hypothetical protein
MGQKLGLALMRELVAIARQACISELIAEVLRSNGGMLNVFQKAASI